MDRRVCRDHVGCTQRHSEAGGCGDGCRIVDGVKVYGAGATLVRALDGVTADFATGEFCAVMGPSGSGKSTLLHCLAGLDRLTSGQVLIDDVDLSRLNDKAMTLMRRERVGFVFQSFNLVPTLTAGENIVLPLTLAGRKPKQEWFEALVTSLGIGDRLRHRPSELSGGQQQRVAMGRALITRPASCSPTSPPETWTPSRPTICSNRCDPPSTSSGRQW